MHAPQQNKENNIRFSHHSSQACPRVPSRVAVIRREFVDLTGDHFSAVVLNQLLYWTQRVKDFDLLLEEERTFNPDCNVSPRHGWIYKTAPELIEETMLKATPPTMRKHLKFLIDHGWVDERPNPMDKWNKTTQYRVNLRKLQEDLRSIGHTLPETYRAFFEEEIYSPLLPRKFSSVEERSNTDSLQLNENRDESIDSSCLSRDSSKKRNLPSRENTSEHLLHPSKKIFSHDVKNFGLKEKSLPSNEKIFGSYTYTENTSENRNREHAQRTCAREDFDEILEIWKKHVGQEGLQLTDSRRRQLRSLLVLYFDGELQQWEQFCERIKSSPFLMGQGPRKWHVTLDWILEESNLIKVLEGNFDDPGRAEQKQEKECHSNKERERSELLASIEDPSWKYWCTQLSRSDLKDPLSVFELKEIAPAKFAEFDGKLVWIESENKRTLDRIDSLRLKLLSVVQHSFPKARNIRTQLKVLTARPSFEGTQTASYSSAT